MDSKEAQLFSAVRRCDAAKAAKLIGRGADINAKDWEGRPPSPHKAAEGCRSAVVKCLIGRGEHRRQGLEGQNPAEVAPDLAIEKVLGSRTLRRRRQLPQKEKKGRE